MGQFLQGTHGDDEIEGSKGNDTLIGGRGDDILFGDVGSDTYVFSLGDGFDVIMDGGIGDDLYDLNVLQFTNVNPWNINAVLQLNGDWIISYGDQDDLIVVVGADIGSSYGIQIVRFADGTVWNRSDLAARVQNLVIGTEGDDTLWGTSRNELLFGGSGNDTLRGGEGSDTYLFSRGDGADTIQERIHGWSFGDLNTLRFLDINPGDIDFVRLSGFHWEIGYGGLGDQITLLDADWGSAYGVQRVEFADGTVWDRSELDARLVAQPVQGSNGDDWLDGTRFNDLILGGAGHDVLSGYGGNDTLEGGLGHDTLYGDEGSDTYVFSRGDGIDTLVDWAHSESGDHNTLRFTDINPGDIDFVRLSGGDWVLGYGGQGDQITLQSAEILDEHGVHSIEFADGTVWDRHALDARLVSTPLRGSDWDDWLQGTRIDDLILGGAGDDFIDGGAGNDVLNGGTGDDFIAGGSGSDTYVFSRGDGKDWVNDQTYHGPNGDLFDHNIIRFTDIRPSDIDFVQLSGWDWVIGYGGQEDEIVLINAERPLHGVQAVHFADGTVWSRSELKALIVHENEIVGTHNNDTLYGSVRNDLLQGGAGNDILSGDAGDDTLEGGDGDDTLYGMEGSDLLIGGRGNDHIDGGRGNDVYVFSRGDGADTILDHAFTNWDTNQLEHNIIRFTDINPADIDFVQAGDWHWVIGYGGRGDQITLLSAAFSDFFGVQALHFADGTVWDRSDLANHRIKITQGTQGNDVLHGHIGHDQLVGGAGHDALRGLAGNDTLIGGAGNDILNGGTGNDWAWFDDAPSGIEVRLWRDRVVNDGHGGTDTIVGVEHIRGSEHDDWISGNWHANRLEGGAGNDTLRGGSGNDSLEGGLGADQLVGGSGSDVFVLRSVADSGVGPAQRDLIVDFERGLDKIDLSALDANAEADGHQAFTALTVGTHFNGSFASAGELFYDSTAQVLYGSVSNNGVADFAIGFGGLLPELGLSDFML